MFMAIYGKNQPIALANRWGMPGKLFLQREKKSFQNLTKQKILETSKTFFFKLTSGKKKLPSAAAAKRDHVGLFWAPWLYLALKTTATEAAVSSLGLNTLIFPSWVKNVFTINKMCSVELWSLEKIDKLLLNQILNSRSHGFLWRFH